MSNQHISLLYGTVLHNDVLSHAVTYEEIKAAIENMIEVYKPRRNSLSSTENFLADYNTVAHRCAYLHKYAAFHTAIVRDVLNTVLNQDVNVFRIFYRKLTTSSFKICSLGGGPGSDVVGIIAALSEIAVFQCSAKVVDLKGDWGETWWSVIHELRCRDYGVLGQCFQAENFSWEYLTADLLENEVEDDVTEAIGDADCVTMVKFVSAASCKNTETMLMKIFSMLKSGSIVLFIDNASGGFSKLVSIVSKKCHMRYVFGPIDHKLYTNEDLKDSLCGYTSCFSTKLTIHMLQKLGKNRESNGIVDQSRRQRESNPIIAPSKWDIDSNFIVDQSGWVRETFPMLSQLKCEIESNRTVSIAHNSRWVRKSYPIVAHRERELNLIEAQAERGRELIPIVAPSRCDRESNFIVDPSRWDRESNFIVNPSRLDREPNPIVAQSIWERESNSIESQTGWGRETNPIVATSRWVRELNPIVDQSIWERESNSIESQTGWGRETNPIVAPSRWGRESIPIEDQSGWVRETFPMLSQLKCVSTWDRESNFVVARPRRYRGENPMAVRLRVRRDKKYNPILPRSRWERKYPILARSRWGRKSNSIVPRSRWDR